MSLSLRVIAASLECVQRSRVGVGMNRFAREGKVLKRFERSDGPDIALYRNYILCYPGRLIVRVVALEFAKKKPSGNNIKWFSIVLHYASLIPITGFMRFSDQLFNE